MKIPLNFSIPTKEWRRYLVLDCLRTSTYAQVVVEMRFQVWKISRRWAWANMCERLFTSPDSWGITPRPEHDMVKTGVPSLRHWHFIELVRIFWDFRQLCLIFFEECLKNELHWIKFSTNWKISVDYLLMCWQFKIGNQQT